MKQQKKNLIDTMVKTRFSPVEESTFSIYEEYESLLSPDDTDDICTLCFYRGESYFNEMYQGKQKSLSFVA